MKNLLKKFIRAPWAPFTPTLLLFLFFALTAHAGFKLESPDFKPDHALPQRFEFNGFGCNGQNQSPALKWSGAPAGTQSFALTLYDPDAPTGSGWWHWVVVDIPANVHELPADAGNVSGAHLPGGARQIRVDFGQAAFGGVCPPKGDKRHHYIFTLYALKTSKLEIPADATAALAGFMIHANMLAKARLTATYQRK